MLLYFINNPPDTKVNSISGKFEKGVEEFVILTLDKSCYCTPKINWLPEMCCHVTIDITMDTCLETTWLITVDTCLESTWLCRDRRRNRIRSQVIVHILSWSQSSTFTESSIYYVQPYEWASCHLQLNYSVKIQKFSGKLANCELNVNWQNIVF